MFYNVMNFIYPKAKLI